MIDVVTVGAGGGSIAWLSPEGTLKVGPRSAGADPGPMCYPAGGDRADRHRRARGARPDPAAPAGRGDPAVDVDAARAGLRRSSARELGLSLERTAHRHPGDLRVEPGQRAAPGDRRPRARRPRLHADHVRRLGLAAGLPADGHPRACRARSCRRTRATCQRVRAAHRRRPQRLRADRRQPARRRSTSTGCARRSATWRSRPRHGAGRRGIRPRRAAAAAHAPTCATSARRSRCGCRWPTARSTAARPRRSPQAFHAAHRAAVRLRLRRRPAPGRGVGEPAGQRDRADPPSGGGRAGAAAGRDGPGRHGLPAGVLRRRWVDDADLRPARPRRRGRRARAGGHRGVRLHRAGAPRLRRRRRRATATCCSPGSRA